MNNVRKCPHCNKVFFSTDNNLCPFCKKDINEAFNSMPEFFKDIFGGFKNDR